MAFDQKALSSVCGPQLRISSRRKFKLLVEIISCGCLYVREGSTMQNTWLLQSNTQIRKELQTQRSEFREYMWWIGQFMARMSASSSKPSSIVVAPPLSALNFKLSSIFQFPKQYFLILLYMYIFIINEKKINSLNFNYISLI